MHEKIKTYIYDTKNTDFLQKFKTSHFVGFSKTSSHTLLSLKTLRSTLFEEF